MQQKLIPLHVSPDQDRKSSCSRLAALMVLLGIGMLIGCIKVTQTYRQTAWPTYDGFALDNSNKFRHADGYNFVDLSLHTRIHVPAPPDAVFFCYCGGFAGNDTEGTVWDNPNFNITEVDRVPKDPLCPSHPYVSGRHRYVTSAKGSGYEYYGVTGKTGNYETQALLDPKGRRCQINLEQYPCVETTNSMELAEDGGTYLMFVSHSRLVDSADAVGFIVERGTLGKFYGPKLVDCLTNNAGR